MIDPFIQAIDVTKRYQMGNSTLCALDRVSTDIEKGEFLAVLGPSGSGKSTLMNLLGGLDVPENGNLYVKGKDLSKLSDNEMSSYRNKTVGFVFQSFNLDNSLTAIENVTLPLMYAGIRRSLRKEMAFEALKSVGLSDRINHRPSELSGGQRQRVSIARAIVNRPEIVLADEPTGNLDTHSGEMVMDLLKSLNSEGFTIVMVTHNPVQARLANRVIEIIDGKIVRDEKNLKH
jgi:putative ABC transport system ATP-binding protein